tara:strand:+ start:14983 stop:15897 length:915 start_codon:yes stop_codon:yes gene_type:complete
MNIHANDFGKVAVVMGGWSSERNISIESGNAVLQGLRDEGISAQAIDMNKNILETLKNGNFDRVFNVVHGRGGEDGQLQGALEVLKLPYTGSNVIGSAIAMDKYRTKLIWQSLGIPTPGFALIDDENQLREAEELGFPLMIKAALEGSSIGIEKADNAEELNRSWNSVRKYKSHVIAEKWIEGEEYSASILGNTVLPIVHLKASNKFYDYEAKYISKSTEYSVPCGLDEKQEKESMELCLRAFKASGAAGWGRVDFLIDSENRNWLIEVNTVPGMTKRSLFPMAAEAAGINFNQLVRRILENTI